VRTGTGGDTQAEHLRGVADVGVPVTLSQGISPSFRGWTGDLDGLAIIAGEDLHVAGLQEHEISVGRGEPGAATSLSQGRVDARGASEVVGGGVRPLGAVLLGNPVKTRVFVRNPGVAGSSGDLLASLQGQPCGCPGEAFR